ncbi:ATP-binding protein [Mesorhizobium sp.]|uniref:ATP-binding protein n=1 Tax=Mesorhizobium sp. TaxID=1871066 RepID=UPI0011F8FF05|nr:ATP-binding protein [Mesorhizobium sp.]TIN25731.1 MAG: sensor histidine kinase [Mesorhizobium sp.]TJU75694.1 MAG: sensor histidine kinase [Mesorhizobium sp.]
MEKLSNPGEVAALRVADEAFLVASTIERCPKTMMIRELFMNALEAAIVASSGPRSIEIRALNFGSTQKLSIWNTGPGMSSEELHRVCDIASSIGKDKGLDNNFGMGAKVASLPSNRYGLRYRSNKNGVVSEVVLGERGGVYGRLRRPNGEGQLEEVFDVTDAARAEGADLRCDWTEVVLFGNRSDQNTVKDPYDGNPSVPGQWLADYLYYRFYRLPEGLSVRFLPGTHKLDGSRYFRTIPDRAFPLGRSQSVVNDSGLIIHYFYDPPMAGTSHNRSVSGAITSDVSTCALVHKDELYDLKRSRQWTLDAPLYGIPFGAKHISVHVELPSDYPVRPEAYRQFLRYREADQRQVEIRDFSDLVREHRPAWLLEIINSFAPTDTGSTDEIRDELQKLLNSLRVKSPNLALDQSGKVQAAFSPGRGFQEVDSDRGKAGDSKRHDLDDLLAVPQGAKRATVSLNADRAPEITLLHDEEQIEEKGLKGKAAKFYRDAA